MTFVEVNENGIIKMKSSHSFQETFERLKSNVASKGLTVFAAISFSYDAAKAGLKMNPSKMLIFGNPRAGTPLMVAAPTVALDFPLKVLVSEDGNEQVWLSYNSPLYLKERHHIPDGLLKNIAGIAVVVEAAAN